MAGIHCVMNAGQKNLVVFGTRPEAIKLAPVILALQADIRAETIVRSLVLFTETLSKLSRDPWYLEQELDRCRNADNPPPGQGPSRHATKSTCLSGPRQMAAIPRLKSR